MPFWDTLKFSLDKGNNKKEVYLFITDTKSCLSDPPCNGHGICDGKNGQCNCNSDYSGHDCSSNSILNS